MKYLMNKVFVIFAFLSVTPSSSVYADEDKDEGIQVDVIIKDSRSWDGGVLPEYENGIPEITILKVVIPPHTRLSLHKHPIINAGYLVKGKLTVISEEGKVLYLEAGDPIIELVNKYHYGKNESNENSEIIVFYAGVKGSKLSIKK